MIPLKQDLSQKPAFKSPYPYEIQIGNLKETVNVDIADAFASAGVDFAKLKSIGGWTSRNGRVVTLESTDGVERTISEKQFQAEEEACLGPFRRGIPLGEDLAYGALVSGLLNYGAKSLDGKRERRSIKFETIVWIIDANRKGKPLPPSYLYSTKFAVSGKNYERRVSISQELKAGKANRFLMRIGFDKSSLHRFRIRLAYNSRNEIVSPDIELLGFVPRLGIHFLQQDRIRRGKGIAAPK